MQDAAHSAPIKHKAVLRAPVKDRGKVRIVSVRIGPVYKKYFTLSSEIAPGPANRVKTMQSKG
jgi:hypothetical protein